MNLTLTAGVATDVSQAGFVLYDEGTTGYPGAPFGSIAPSQVYGFDVVYLAIAPSGGGFTFSWWTTDGTGGPGTTPDEAAFTFESISFVDDDDATWTFAKADAANPLGNTFSFGGDDVREFAWTVDPSTVPALTEGVEYVVSFNEAAPPDTSDTSSGPVEFACLAPVTPPLYRICAADTSVMDLIAADDFVRLYPFGEARQKDTYPYAVWQLVGGSPFNYLGQCPDTDAYSTQVDVYGKTWASARETARAIQVALQADAYVTNYNGEFKDPETKSFRVSFVVEFVERRT